MVGIRMSFKRDYHLTIIKGTSCDHLGTYSLRVIIALAPCLAVPTNFIKIRVIWTEGVVFERTGNREFIPLRTIFIVFY